VHSGIADSLWVVYSNLLRYLVSLGFKIIVSPPEWSQLVNQERISSVADFDFSLVGVSPGNCWLGDRKGI